MSDYQFCIGARLQAWPLMPRTPPAPLGADCAIPNQISHLRGNLHPVTEVRCGPNRLRSSLFTALSWAEDNLKIPMATSAFSRNQIAKRRSSRIALNAPVGLTGEDRAKASFTLTANATNLNRHGAAVQVTRELLVGTTVLVQNKRGARLSARIVAQVNPIQGKLTYGIEFVEDNDKSRNFWGITFPANA